MKQEIKNEEQEDSKIAYHIKEMEEKNKEGEKLYQEKQYQEAEKLYLEVIKGRENLLGPCHKETLQTKYNYAITLKALNRYKEAEKVFLEVIEG